MRRILLVEDESMTRDGVATFLSAKGYAVTAVEDGQAAIDQFYQKDFDLVILDIMLPKLNGFEVLKEIRAHKRTPVLMLTAMDDEPTQVMSFEEQADDYMSKPFSLVILEKRIEALLRRIEGQNSPDIWHYKQATVDFSGYTATLNQVPIDIKPKEVNLLQLLLKYPNQVLSREQMLEQLWGAEEAPYDRVIDVYIKNLRKKLQLDCIKTVKGIGYKYEAD